MSSSLYLVKIRSIFSRQPLPLSSTVYESEENALPSLLATASPTHEVSRGCVELLPWQEPTRVEPLANEMEPF